jgi:hypothetical protein
MLRPLIVERARKRGWHMPTIRKLFEALDVIMAASRCHGEHDGVPMAPAFEMTHPLALALLDRRMPTGLPKRARYVRGKTEDDEKKAQRARSLHRSADADWRERVERLDALGIIHYRPGRGLAKHVANAAPVPSVYALPIVWEKLKVAGRGWIARALDKPKRFFASAHWARRDLLWQLLTGEPKPTGTYAKRAALARWLGAPDSVAPDLAVELPARREVEPVQALVVAEHNEEAREGWGMVNAAKDAIRPGRAKPAQKVALVEFPGVVSVSARAQSQPLLGEELPSVVTSQGSSAPTHERAGTARGIFESLRSWARPSDESAKAREAELHSKRASGRETCARCEDVGTLPAVGATPGRACPDCCSKAEVPPHMLLQPSAPQPTDPPGGSA